MSNKTIKINPELFHVSGRKKGDKQKSMKQKSNKIKSSAIKTELIKKIKEHRKKENFKKNIKDSIDNPNDFQESMDYLQNLHEKRMRKKTLKKKMQNPAVSIELPSELSSYEHKIPDPIIDTNLKSISSELNEELQGTAPTIEDNKIPLYSCLKNSEKPTYREWKKKTQTNKEEPTIVIEGPPIEKIKGTNENLLSDIKNIYKNCDKKITKRKTKKYKLGKHNKTVSILISNNHTRKKVQSEISDLKKTKMLEIKNYLKKKGLIKVGSIAPNNILRSMYENAILAGDIKNTSSTNLIHNYMAESN